MDSDDILGWLKLKEFKNRSKWFNIASKHMKKEKFEALKERGWKPGRMVRQVCIKRKKNWLFTNSDFTTET